MAIESVYTAESDDELTYHPPADTPGPRNIYTLLRLAKEDPGSDEEDDDADLCGGKKRVCRTGRSDGDDMDLDDDDALVRHTDNDARDDAQVEDEELEEGGPLTLPEEDYFKLLRAFGTYVLLCVFVEYWRLTTSIGSIVGRSKNPRKSTATTPSSG